MLNTFAFLDDFCLQQRHQLKRRFFPLQPIAGSGYNDPLLHAAYSTIQYVPEDDRYYMWANFNTVFTDLSRPEQCLLALAESEDGIHYRRARGTVPGVGGVDNVVFNGLGHSVHGATVLYDPRDPEPSRRFKCAAALDEPGSIMAYAPCTISTSPDGRHWTADKEKYVWSRFWSDSYNALIWNPVLECYQVFCRAVGTDRRICTVTSQDLVHWSEPRVVLHPDTQDGPGVEFYAMPVHYFNGVFYGYLWIYETDDEDPVAYKMAGRIQSELVYSYDGLSWNRTRQPVISPQDYEGDLFGTVCVEPYNTILNREGNQFLTVATLSRMGHGDGLYASRGANHLPLAFRQGDPDICRRVICSLKPGRYCGLEAVGNSARLHTKNFLLSRKNPELSINVACPCGEMRVQLLDTRNHPVPGFTFEDCVPFRGNELAWKPLWQKRRLEEAAGKLFNLEIELHNGCIFGITGEMRPHHGSLPLNGFGDVGCAAMEAWGTLDKAPDYDSLELS